MSQVNISFRVDEKLKEDLRKYCEENDVKASQVIRKILREFLEKNSST